MRKLFALSAAALAFAASPVFAQTEEPGAESGEPGTGFNQFYIGGSFGTASSAGKQTSILFDRNLDGRFGDTITTAAGADAFSPGFCSGVATSTGNGNCDFDRDGLEYYGRLGADTQRGRFVIGFVVEGGRPELNESVAAFSTTPANYTLTRNVRYNINARGRFGYTPNDSTLFYVAGGPTYAKVRTALTTTNTANSFSTSGSQDEWGFNAGGGIEQKVGRNFSIGLEYLYTDVKADRSRAFVRAGTAPATNPFLLAGAGGSDFRFSRDNMRWHSVRLVGTFRF